MESQVRITAFVAERLALKFARLTRRTGVSATALFARTLPAELDCLAGIPANKHDGLTAALVRLLDANEPPPRRLNITLKRKDAARMNRLCREKRVRRDEFISAYVSLPCERRTGGLRGPAGADSRNPEEPPAFCRRRRRATGQSLRLPARGL